MEIDLDIFLETVGWLFGRFVYKLFGSFTEERGERIVKAVIRLEGLATTAPGYAGGGSGGVMHEVGAQLKEGLGTVTVLWREAASLERANLRSEARSTGPRRSRRG